MATKTGIFDTANRSIVDDIKREWRLQGHYLTGNLERSLQERVIEENGDIVLTAEALAYLEQLEKETPADQISLSQTEYMQLVNWVQLRGMASGFEEATKVASAILKKWHEEGRPTENSKTFSQTGERTKAITTTFETNDGRYGQIIDNTVVGQFDNEFNTIKSGTI